MSQGGRVPRSRDPFPPGRTSKGHRPERQPRAERVPRATVNLVDPMKDYLSRIGRTALLTAEQEVDLAKRIEVSLFARERLETIGDDLSLQDKQDLEWIAVDGARAKAHMVEANLRLVVSLAKRYMGHGLQLNDLVQEGNLGLIRAVEKFEYRQGLKFSTYAVWWIKQAISRALADQSRTIRIPVHVVEVLNRMTRVRRRMMQDLGREPTSKELAAELDVTAEKVEWLRRQAREPLSLHTPLGEDGDGELGDVIEDPDGGDPPTSSRPRCCAASSTPSWRRSPNARRASSRCGSGW